MRPRSLAEPEGKGRRRSVSVFYEHTAGGFHALDTPTGVTQEDDVPGSGVDGEVLVEGRDLYAFGLQDNVVERGVGDGATVRDGYGASATARVKLAVDAIAQQVRAVTATRGLDAVREQDNNLVEELAGEVAVGIGAAQDVVEGGLIPWLGADAGDDLLHQDVGGLWWNLQKVKLAGAHFADEGSLFEKVVARGGEEAAFGNGSAPVAGAAHALHGDGDRAGGGDLADEVYISYVNAQLKRSGSDEDADLTVLQALLGVEAEFAGERAMVRGDAAGAKLIRQAFGEGVSDSLDQAAGVDEDQGGAMGQGVGAKLVEDLLPHGAAGDGAEFVGGDFDGEIEGTALTDLDDRCGLAALRAVLDASRERRSRVYIPLIAMSGRRTGHLIFCFSQGVCGAGEELGY